MEYVAFSVVEGEGRREGEVLISTLRAATNMAYQGFTAEFGKVNPLVKLVGQVCGGGMLLCYTSTVLLLGHNGNSPQCSTH